MAENPNRSTRDWKKRESFSSAMIQIAIVGVVLAVAAYFFYGRSERRKLVADSLKDAKALVAKDNPKDLARAQAKLEEIFAVDADAKDALAVAADVNTELWLTHLSPGAEQKAREYLKKAEAAESRTEERYGNKLLHLIADGKSSDAEKYGEDLRKQGASSAKLWYGIGWAYQTAGNLPLARGAFTQATEKAWKNPRYFAGYGEALLDQADYRNAVEILQKGLSNSPDHLRLSLNLALARIYRAERVKDAQDAINEALALGDDLTPGLKARALAGQAEIANFEQKYDDAIKSADAALAINPNERFALFAKARAVALKKDPSARDAFQKAIAANPSAPIFYFTGAELLQAAGNHEGAMALLADYEKFFGGVQVTDSDGKTRTVLERDDKYQLVRGDILRQAGKQDEAMAAYDKAIAINSVNLARAHFAKGALLLDKKDFDKALEELNLVTPEDGTGQIAEAYEAKGRVLFAKKDYPLGCQNFAFALARMKTQQAPREKLNALLEDVTRHLNANGQKNMAKAWDNEARPIIQ